MPQNPRQLVVCYISGLDRRRVDSSSMEFLAAQFETSPWMNYRNLPSNELFPTLVTGVDPTVHGVWGVRLGSDLDNALEPRWFDRLPERLVTSVQCAVHFLTNNFDLAAIPPRRRRRFDITRTKYRRRGKRADALYSIGRVPTVMEFVGRGMAEYHFSSDYDPSGTVLDSLCNPDKSLEILELYSLDRYQQWNLHDPESVAAAYRTVDRFLQRLHRKCLRKDKTLMVVSDHGHESITRSHDLGRLLQPLRLTDNDYTAFVEVSSARFWFHTERARRGIEDVLRGIDGSEIIRHDQMADYGVPLCDASYGELFCWLPPGAIFFPHDFYQPLANWFFGVIDPMQRSRLRSPQHRGNHGHLPHHAAEESFVLLASSDFRPRPAPPRPSILDIAPSMLSVMGLARPDFMPGRALFEPA